MTFTIDFYEAGDPICTHKISGETEQELFHNAKNHTIQEHGMTAENLKKVLRRTERSIGA